MLLLVACQAGSPKLGDADEAPPEPSVSIAGTAAFDPLLGGAGSWTVASEAGDEVTVEVLDAGGAVVATLDDTYTWEGAAVGRYTVRATLLAKGSPVAEAETPVDVVRVGVLDGTLGGDRIPLLWHGGGRGAYVDDGGAGPTFRLSAITEGDAAVAIPAPWDDLWAPPDDTLGQNLPAAYAWDARPTLALTVDGELGGADLTAAIDGWTLTSGGVADGGTLVFTKDEALAPGPGVVEEPLTLRWMAGDDLAGEQALPLRTYAMLGPPAFEQTGSPYLPWVAVIDPALRAMQGVAPDEAAVVSALVDHVYWDLGLAYDTQWGASAYTQYTTGEFDGAHFDLSGFLDRRRGSTVNCTDCAAILEAFANMVGATLQYTILVRDFNLNYIKAVGGSEYTRCPFGTGGCGFSYHAVTTPDDAATIFDATLALDGDDNPSTTPNTELLVQAIDGEEYLDRLVLSGRVRYAHTQKETIQ
ncbi:MAG: hypothetical protein ACOZNI_34370 [Myxococcota bacterium]